MSKDIKLQGRYGLVHYLKHLEGNEYLFQSELSCRILYNGDDIIAIDPSGGPMMKVGSDINNMQIKEIKFRQEDPKGYILTLIPLNRPRKYQTKHIGQLKMSNVPNVVL
jgi:hypothetical protein